LQRSYAHQDALERQCKNFDIPFSADRPEGIFNDAPVNDLLMFLRLLAYPEDRLAYAALIRSPFMRLSDVTLSVCLLKRGAAPFDEALETDIPPEDLELYRRARGLYRAMSDAARTLPVTGILTRLWYDEGYRYETLWSRPSQIYGELFDLFFEVARNMDSRGKSLPDFLDYMDGLVNREEKLDDLNLPPEGGTAGVRLMSIHRSKGLEFPVVFVFGCGSERKRPVNGDTVYFSDRWGLSLNLPPAGELPGEFGNYFYNIGREEEALKETAELRRLLYVAMTRAESRLFVTASLPKAAGDAGIAGDTAQSIRERLAALYAKRPEAASSFLDLLIPPLVTADGGDAPFVIEPIPLRTREEIRHSASNAARDAARRARSGAPVSMADAAARAAHYYDRAETIVTPPPPLTSLSASELELAGPAARAFKGGAQGAAEDDPVDRVIRRAGLEAADFGTVVHGFLEALFKNAPPRIPPRIQARLGGDRDLPLVREAAERLARGFIDSDLGQMSLRASFREAEFPLVTMMEAGAGKIPVSGRIDLLFEWEGAMHVVDFKTDRVREPERYLPQLAVYRRAVSDIFGKPVRAWLFYLRGAHAAEVTEQAAARGESLPLPLSALC
jgi:ATP-dependent helicase/nuclease subunit A